MDPQIQPKRKPHTEEEILRGARHLSDSIARECNVNKDDYWKQYHAQSIALFKGALQAMEG